MASLGKVTGNKRKKRDAKKLKARRKAVEKKLKKEAATEGVVVIN